MANATAHRQGQVADGLPIPAIIEVTRGRHRKTRPVPARPTQPSHGRGAGRTPAPIPPHPPLVSGGWYHSLARSEVLGPGRFAVPSPADKSVGVALTLGALLGPGGLCYTSITAGLIFIGLSAITLILTGVAALLVIWPVSITASAISAHLQHRWHERQ
jgi:hypothetical protein